MVFKIGDRVRYLSSFREPIEGILVPIPPDKAHVYKKGEFSMRTDNGVHYCLWPEQMEMIEPSDEITEATYRWLEYYG